MWSGPAPQPPWDWTARFYWCSCVNVLLQLFRPCCAGCLAFRTELPMAGQSQNMVSWSSLSYTYLQMPKLKEKKTHCSSNRRHCFSFFCLGQKFAVSVVKNSLTIMSVPWKSTHIPYLSQLFQKIDVLMVALNSAANPITYYVLMPAFRSKIRQLLCFWKRHQVAPAMTPAVSTGVSTGGDWSDSVWWIGNQGNQHFDCLWVIRN